jgi:hypothetical protein
MYMIDLHTKFQNPSVFDVLVVSIKLESEENFCMGAMLLFYNLKDYSNRNCIFFLRSIIIHHVRTLIYMAMASPPPNSQVYRSAMLLFLAVGS